MDNEFLDFLVLLLNQFAGGPGSPANNLVRFGLPADYWPAFTILWVAVILTLVLVVFALLAWVRRTWSLPRRLLFTLVTLAAVAFTSLAAFWGLLVLPF